MGVWVPRLAKLLIFFTITTFVFGCGSEPVQRGSGVGSGYKGGRANDKFALIKKKVALLRVFNESPYGGPDLGVNVTEELRVEIGRTGEFIIDSEGQRIFGSSKEIYAGGGAKLTQMARRAKLTGINFVLYGRIVDARVREKTDDIGLIRETRAYAEAKVELKIYDIQNQKEVFSRTFLGYANDKTFRFFKSDSESQMEYRQEMLRYAVKVATRRILPPILALATKMDWMGRVAKIIGTKIYINAGRASGIHVGDILKVLTEGEEIYDPETGALIGLSKGEVKGTLEVIDYFGPDGATAVVHSGGTVSEGDFVMLY